MDFFLFFFSQLDLSIIDNEGDESNYQPNGEFELEGFRPERHVVYYSCCDEPYIDITYYIQLRRRPMFYVFNLILPCILINGIGERTGFLFFFNTKNKMLGSVAMCKRNSIFF